MKEPWSKRYKGDMVGEWTNCAIPEDNIPEHTVPMKLYKVFTWYEYEVWADSVDFPDFYYIRKRVTKLYGKSEDSFYKDYIDDHTDTDLDMALDTIADLKRWGNLW